MAESSKPSQAEGRHAPEMESAEYIADLTTQLATLARQSRLDFLGHLLEITSLEARMVADRREGHRAEDVSRRVVRAIQGRSDTRLPP
jgi:hypothetical protein